jgi:hypothetical protein
MQGGLAKSLILSCVACANMGVTASLWAYGNEYEVVSHYLDQIAPRYTNLNVTVYHSEIDDCPYKHVYPCQEAVSNVFAQKARLWTPQRLNVDINNAATVLLLPDCDYNFTFLGNYFEEDDDSQQHRSSFIRYMSFEFRVQQSRCSYVNVNVKGGSTFDMFAYTNRSLATCTSRDLFDDSYAISCKVPLLKTVETVAPNCIHVTVILEHEHFDAYSLVVLSKSAAYPSISRVLLNNVTYCGSHHHKRATLLLQSESVRSVNGLDLSTSAMLPAGRPEIYTGIWTRHDVTLAGSWPAMNCSTTFVAAVASCHIQPIVKNDRPASYCPPMWKLPAEASDMLLPNHSLGSSSLFSNMGPCLSDIVSYLNRTGRYSQVSSIAPSVTASLSLPMAFEFWPVKLTTAGAGHLSEVPRYPNIDYLFDESNRGIFSVAFLGASHCRYLFMGTLHMIFGSQAIVNMQRKANVATFANYYFEFSQHADVLVTRTKEICQHKNFQEGTLVLSTGDWDLITGISRVLRVPRFAPALIAYLQDLLENKFPCPNVHHVVFVTGMPYPVCTDNNNVTCATERRYRTNSAIAALNDYYLQGLIRVKVHPSKKLSIVDAFSIVAPRMLMNGNFDVSCGNHFNCAVGDEHGAETQMIYGPSGTAVLQAVLHALSS